MINNIKVIITGVGSASIGMQVLKALRLSPFPYYIIGTDTNSLSYGLSLTDKQYIIPSANDPEYLNTLSKIIEENNVQVLIPGSEAELFFISKNIKVFEEKGVFIPINSFEFIETFSNKKKTVDFFVDKGYPSPKTLFITQQTDLQDVDFFPAIIKPNTNSGGSSNVYIAQTKKELNLITEYLFTYLDNFIIQEYIGTPDNEYTIGVLADMEGHIIGSIVLKRYISSNLSCKTKVKNITGNTSLGEHLVVSSGISQGEIVILPELTDYCEKVAKDINAKGSVNFQCRTINDKVYIFEINPRFSGTTSLRAMVGFNEPDILIKKYILKEEPSKINYQTGIILRDLEERLLN